MQHMQGWMKGVLCVAACLSQAAVAEVGKPSAFMTQVRVEVGPDGSIVSAQADKGLHEKLRDSIERRVGAWTFSPPTEQGKPVSAVTYVQVAACLVPKQDAVNLAIANAGNGPYRPTLVQFQPRSAPPPGLLSATALQLTIDYNVLANGHATFEQVHISSPTDARGARWLEGMAAQWVRAQRFKPEQLNNVPVSTRMQTNITLSGGPTTPRDLNNQRSLELTRQALSPECLQALGDTADQTVVVDSPIKLLPRG
ncbi:energy transducer TonB [Xanthomonas sp. WHRI 6108]|uniref:energy transducer TonB n=1 Tax=Xanthomonas sp. WHRI 6108 TaxID=3161567 RepID=UPI0032E8D286